MFNLTKKDTLLTSNFLRNSIDCHTHILPCVDDGLSSVADAVEILNFYRSVGVKDVVFTPHISTQFPHNNYTSLRKHYENFTAVYKGDVRLYLAAEYMLDSDFEKHMEGDKLLTFFDDHLLLEFPNITLPFNYIKRIENIMSAGYFVVLAHPERYLYFDKERFHSLKRIGVKFQLNLFSLLHGYDKVIRKRAISYLKDDLYDFWGSDTHSTTTIDCIQQKRVSRSVVNALLAMKNKNKL